MKADKQKEYRRFTAREIKACCERTLYYVFLENMEPDYGNNRHIAHFYNDQYFAMHAEVRELDAQE